MKFNLFKNDKATIKDEICLFVFIVACIGVGAALIALAPSFWIISVASSKAFGVLWVLAGITFIPSLIYRLYTNKIDKRH